MFFADLFEDPEGLHVPNMVEIGGAFEEQFEANDNKKQPPVGKLKEANAQARFTRTHGHGHTRMCII